MGPEALAGSASQKTGIPILSDNKYSEWDASIRKFCLYIEFIDYFNGDLNSPSEATPELLMKYKELTQKAAGVTCQSLDTNKQQKFLSKSNKKNSKVLYDSITSYYQSNQRKNQARVFCNLLAAYAAESNQYPALSYIDTAASSHTIGHWKSFQSYKKKTMSVETANGSHTSVFGHGLVEFKSNDYKFKLHCIHVPKIKETMISMGKLWDNGFLMIRRDHNHFDIKNNKGVLMNGRVCNNMFELPLEIVPQKNQN
ncbi:hypothetical protein O181_018538 [Austropuccinia psidii MF-1]|uniref:Retrovirus-related Pol polyprotein from transposon TNT 1-94-like beta-barrel domain-containing protein n=1 Tax=Austropuccinia psidii MF-1 TaxID=1389203 RepID=A0A9Q3GST0_9BASI|nr:hypothetical protein [Austropuccinia psidii MF-1]